MDKDFVKIIMNPVRQRIIQYLILHQKGTPREIAEELSDIPPASLYRHIKMIYNAGLIEVVEERAVRGATEKTYALVSNPVGDPSQDDISLLIQNTILSLLGSFTAYFAHGNADPVGDMLTVTTSTLLLTDSEFAELLGKIGEIYNGVIYNQPKEGRKMRNLTIISSPANNI